MLVDTIRAARVSKQAALPFIMMSDQPVPARSLTVAALSGIPESLSTFVNNPH